MVNKPAHQHCFQLKSLQTLLSSCNVGCRDGAYRTEQNRTSLFARIITHFSIHSKHNRRAARKALWLINADPVADPSQLYGQHGSSSLDYRRLLQANMHAWTHSDCRCSIHAHDHCDSHMTLRSRAISASHGLEHSSSIYTIVHWKPYRSHPHCARNRE